MLIRFSVENWMSFKEKATFSSIATNERQHGKRIPKIKKLRKRILPVAAIYGANASGKTNFFKAIHFSKELVVKGTQPDNLISVEPFILGSSEQAKQPTKFEFDILIDNAVYSFSFSLNNRGILEEKLMLVSVSDEKLLYHRKSEKHELELPAINDELRFAFRGTRNNQLFLTNSISQNIDDFRPVYNWFKNNLQLIGPESAFIPFEQFFNELSPLYKIMNEKLSSLDTGVVNLGSEKTSFEDTPFPKIIKMQLKEELDEGTTVRLTDDQINERFVITKDKGKLIAKKLVSYHLNSDGSKTKFNISQESDGTQRVIDMLPAFVELTHTQHKKVYVIDELDRSLHTHLTRSLLDNYLDNCSNKTRSQLLFTTHDLLLMDQKLLRRDEIWITDRKNNGSSSLIPLSDYENIRYDKDIQKSYLQGRFGGIPRVLI